MDCRLLSFNQSCGFRLFAATNIAQYRLSSYSPRLFLSRTNCSMKSYKLSDLTRTEVDGLKARPRIDFSSIFGVVQPIVDDIRNRGDAAVKDYTMRFDKVELDGVVENVNDLPDPVLDAAVQEAFDVAYNNIFAFHAAQKPVEKIVENMEGVKCKRVARSISSVGLYVPGGTAVLPSTALMLSVPAQIAGCKTIVLATPPAQDGSICKEVIYCAKKAGVTHILKAGGAQAISAMAWGTESCPKDVEENICKFANKGTTASQIGVIPRDSHGIAQVKTVIGSKILRELKPHVLAPEIPEDLSHLIKKAVAIGKHWERNRKDKDSVFGLVLVESRILRLARYYKKTKKLPPAWEYKSISNRIFKLKKKKKQRSSKKNRAK